MVDLTALTARELSRQISTGELSPIAVVEAYLAKIRVMNVRLNAFVDVYEEQARREAERVQARVKGGQLLGPLHGVPIVIKDLFEVNGKTTTAGSLHWRDRKSECTAAVITKLLRCGIIVLGKTQTVEFGLGTSGTNQRLGTPRNPWSVLTHYAPGGSSSGSAVAVAAGLSPLALGTDTGGSVRIPASWCGVVGFKSTYGQISLKGVVPLSPTLDSVGAIAHTVEDIALLYSAMRVNGGSKRRADRVAGLGLPDRSATGTSGLRVAQLPQCERSGVDESVLKVYDEALSVLRTLNIAVAEVGLPKRLDYYLQRNSVITMFEAASLYGHLAEDPLVLLDDRVRSCLEAGRRMAPENYLAARHELPLLRAEFDRIFDCVDAIVTPTTQTVARPVAGVDDASPPNLFTRFVNLLGLCAVALPCGFSPEGLPCSLQVICRRNQEELLLHIAATYQAATRWHRCHPPEARGELPANISRQPVGHSPVAGPATSTRSPWGYAKMQTRMRIDSTSPVSRTGTCP